MSKTIEIWTDGSYQRQSLGFEGHGGWAIYIPAHNEEISDGEVINNSSPYRFELLSILAALSYVNRKGLKDVLIINDNEKAVERCRGLCGGRADIDVIERINEEVKKLPADSTINIKQRDGKYDRPAKRVDELAKDACRAARPKKKDDVGGSFKLKPSKIGGIQ